MAGMNRNQGGLTILEVLIALSIFALIGVASFRILTSVVETQKAINGHSQALGRLQKTMLLLDQDLQQIVVRDIRVDAKQVPYLLVNSGQYPLEFTRGGRANPLSLPRSSLQRVAYSLGSHPKRNVRKSIFFGDDRQYLLRHSWSVLDRPISLQPMVQALLPDINAFSVAVISEKGRKVSWPIKERRREGTENGSTVGNGEKLIALEFNLQHADLGVISRMFGVN